MTSIEVVLMSLTLIQNTFGTFNEGMLFLILLLDLVNSTGSSGLISEKNHSRKIYGLTGIIALHKTFISDGQRDTTSSPSPKPLSPNTG